MKKVTLVLSDGTRFHGRSFGYEQPVAGEVVFNTAMMGYPESLTDPSYAGQMMTLTYPLVGNYGVPPFTIGSDGIATFMESDRIYASAIIVSDYSEQYNHWNAVESLGDWLKREHVPGITGIDTRYRQVLGRRKETDREFYNLYDMYSRSLETDRVLAGLTTVSGSGIVIRLDDSGLVQSLVHDSYLSEILNVLKSAGAQAISINGERIVPTSEVLCLGPSIRVNGVRLFAPYRIAAVGEPDTLLKAYQESRIYSTIVAQNLLYDVQKYDNLIIGAYTGDPNKQITKLY